MNFFFELPDEAQALFPGIQEELRKLWEMLSPLATDELIPADEISSLGASLFYVEEGAFRVAHGSQLLLMMEKGDLSCFHLSCAFQFQSDFAVKVKRLSEEKLVEKILSDKECFLQWRKCTEMQTNFYMLLSANFLPGSLSLDAETELIEEGQAIIEQGSTGREVYTLIDGLAKVVCDGVEVGKVEPNEIFGALAALSESPRTASVIAEEACTVMKLDEQQFLKLIQGRPETMLRLCQDLAKKLEQTNEKIVGSH